MPRGNTTSKMLLQQLYQIILQQLHCVSFPLPLVHKLIQASQGTGGIYFVAVRTCLSHERDNLQRFTPTIGYSNHSMDFRISRIWGPIFLAVLKYQEWELSKLTTCGASSERLQLSQYFLTLLRNKKQLDDLFSNLETSLENCYHELNFAMHFRVLLSTYMENLVLASPMACIVDKIFYFFVPFKHTGPFASGCCILWFPASSWRPSWRGRIKHFPFTSKNFVFTSWALS